MVRSFSLFFNMDCQGRITLLTHPRCSVRENRPKLVEGQAASEQPDSVCGKQVKDPLLPGRGLRNMVYQGSWCCTPTRINLLENYSTRLQILRFANVPARESRKPQQYGNQQKKPFEAFFFCVKYAMVSALMLPKGVGGQKHRPIWGEMILCEGRIPFQSVKE